MNSKVEVVADDGVSLNISYSANQPVTVTLMGPDNQILGSEVFSAGDGHARLKMAQGENSPAAGVYMITVEMGGRTVYENFFAFAGPYLEIENVQFLQWGKKDNLTTIENLSLDLSNEGGLPVYVYRVSVRVQSTLVGAVESWVMPGRRNFSWGWSDQALLPGVSSWHVDAEGRGGD